LRARARDSAALAEQWRWDAAHERALFGFGEAVLFAPDQA
jgi:hypothetical protein